MVATCVVAYFNYLIQSHFESTTVSLLLPLLLVQLAVLICHCVTVTQKNSSCQASLNIPLVSEHRPIPPFSPHSPPTQTLVVDNILHPP